MSIENLEAILRPIELHTEGEDWHEHMLTFDEDMQPRGDYAIQEALHKIFEVKSFQGFPQMRVWYDVLRGGTVRSHSQFMQNIHMMGVLYAFNEQGEEYPTHFFIRKFDGFHGSLDNWKDDLTFPEGTREYSVCAILPKGFEPDMNWRQNPHNHAVVQFTWERIHELGVNVLDILDYITFAGFTPD